MNIRRLLRIAASFTTLFLLIAARPALGLPNLAPYQPSGWSDKIIVARTTGATNDSTGLTTNDTLYVSWAVINNGDAPAGANYTYLYVDGFQAGDLYSASLNTNASSTKRDYSIGKLSAGTHTLTITADATGAVTESSESDNSYTKSITEGNLPNLTPYQPPGWSDKIIVSRTTGATTDSTGLTTADSPTLVGSHSQSVSFTGGAGASRPVSGSSYAAPAISVTPASQDFGSIQVGTTAERSFTVQNTGAGTLSGSTSVPAPFSVVSGSPYSLTASQTTNVTVRYSPTVVGSNSQSVSFTGGAGASRPVSGSSYAAPAISVTPASQDFGSIQVGTTADRGFTVQNTGGGTLSGSASVPAPFSVVSGSPYSLTASQSTDVTVRYSPRVVGGNSQSVSFTGGAGASRPVSGSSYAAPAISVTPASQDFGSIQVSTTADRSFTVQNTGGGTLSCSASVPAPFSVVSGSPYSLTASQTTNVTVRYSPTLVGSNSQSVSFTGGAGASRQVLGLALSVQRPLLTGISLSNGVFHFVLKGPVGSTYVVQLSSNLVNWSPLSTSTIANGGSLTITDSSTTNQPRRFYRTLAL